MNQFKKVFYNCQQATILIEKKNFTRLKFWESIQLGIHLAGCSLCQLYQKQSALIDSLIGEALGNKQQEPLDDVFKRQLQEKIDQQQN